jgi:CubicO group peptidase (beta-lactamase class C family)
MLLRDWQMTSTLKPRLTSIRAFLATSAATLLLVAPLRADDLHSKIDQYLKSRVAAKQFSGGVLVARGDVVLIRSAYGQSGRQHGLTKNNRRLRFPVGDIAEQFVAVAVLRLEEQGKISINASICSYLPNCPSDWKDIQIVHLLTHTSGLPSLKGFFPDHTNSPRSDTLQELLAAVGGQSLEFRPGSEFKYNKLDFIVLSIVIEMVSGRSANEFIEREVFHALKMTDTKYLETMAGDSRNPSLQNHNGRADLEITVSDDPVYSTVEDLYRFDLALTKGTVISSASLLQMLAPFRDGHALGWKINKEFGRRLALQTGQSDGVSISVRLFPDDDVFIVLVGAAIDVDSAQLTHDIAAIVFGKNYPDSRRSTSASPASE